MERFLQLREARRLSVVACSPAARDCGAAAAALPAHPSNVANVLAWLAAGVARTPPAPAAANGAEP